MKNIAYIELDTHAEIALNFMELMNDSQEFSVDYYFSEKILKTLGLQETESIKKVSADNILQNLSKYQLPNTQYDLVLIGTVHRYFSVFERIAELFNTSIICHNLNFVKASNLDLLKSIFKEDHQYRLKLLLKEGLLRKSKVYQKAKNLLVLDENLAQENYKNLPIFHTKFYDDSTQSVEKENLTIVIPGAVSQKRRDYDKVIKELKNLELNFDNYEFRRNETFVENNLQEKGSSVGTTQNLEIIFLGKAQGNELEMLQNFEQNKPENISIKYFTEKVPQNVFDEYMQKADILWCPIQQETEFFSQKEIYGITKMSGNIGDAIKFGKLAIFPENYPSKYPFIIPEIDDLEAQLGVYQKHLEYHFQEKFSKEKVLNQLEKTIFALL